MERRKVIWLVAGGVTLVAAAVASIVALPGAILSLWRRRLPQPIYEPPSAFHVGSLSDFPVGVDTRLLQSYRVFVVRNATRLYVIYGRCSHKGCTPDWVAGEAKFKCPCHESRFCMGSAFDGNGINCAGPAPRPLDRIHVERDADGNVVADVSRLYQWSDFDKPGAYVPVS